jgi:hypothetical protein
LAEIKNLATFVPLRCSVLERFELQEVRKLSASALT